MPNTTSRLSLLEPIGADPVSELRTAITNHATSLDSAVRHFSGTFSNRATVVPSPVDGDEYRGTDTGLVYKYNGTVWLTVMLAGAWTNLTLASGVTALSGAYTPAARLEGDIVRLKGSMQNASGGTLAAGTGWATVPSSVQPSLSVGEAVLAGGASTLTVALVITGTALQIQAAVGPLGYVNLHGLTYSLV